MTTDVSDVTHRKRGLTFEKSQLVEFLVGRRWLTFGARRDQTSSLRGGGEGARGLKLMEKSA